ncbi:aminotransferase class V-fold PLP-dependent enzyme [Acanthopleuribacter pedis]|uniref:cysteine desulfurase n=1 Tax=Acanthopleuribacter pedis TaxID=442870 RepID=A0A8J7U373_9BACT|nr:cysteine desulfurase [Acanthopleuribacter pedis]
MIYFDNNATTAVTEPVHQAMLPFLTEHYGNPSSIHQIGNQARVAVEQARGRVAKAIGARPSEITFCGSGSEADNHALCGVVMRAKEEDKLNPRSNIVITAIEHPAVKKTAEWLGGFFDVQVRTVPMQFEKGTVSLQPFEDAIDADTLVVSVMMANNESGLVLPVAEIAALAKGRGALVHCDGVQALGKLPVDVKKLGVDMFSLSAHKFHGPKGVGALFIKRGVKLTALMHGGSQESGRRAGTENPAGIVGMGVAAELAAAQDTASIAAKRDRFEAGLRERFGDRLVVNFADLPRTPNISSVQFKGADGNLLLIMMDQNGLCASTGSACSSGSLSVSSVLLGMGLKEHAAKGTIRFSLSHLTTDAEIDAALDAVAASLK